MGLQASVFVAAVLATSDAPFLFWLLSQLFTWGASSASVSFYLSDSVEVVLDGRPAGLPAADSWLALGRTPTPDATFQVGQLLSAGGWLSLVQLTKPAEVALVDGAAACTDSWPLPVPLRCRRILSCPLPTDSLSWMARWPCMAT